MYHHIIHASESLLYINKVLTKYYAIGGEGYGGSGFWASGGGGGYSIVSKRTNYGPQGR